MKQITLLNKFQSQLEKKLNEKLLELDYNHRLVEGAKPVPNMMNTLKSQEEIMNAFLINYFGFLGLFTLRVNKAFKEYENSEGSLDHPKQINFEENHDVSYALSKAHDYGLLDDKIAGRLLRILQSIKNKEIKSKKEMSPDAIRRLLDQIDYFDKRPSADLYDIIHRFHSGEYTLSKTTNLLYQLAKQEPYRTMTTEFRKLALTGQYSSLFKVEP